MARPKQKPDTGEGTGAETQEFTYPVYDLWKIDVESIDSDKEGNAKKVKVTAVKQIRKNVKLETNAAELLNKQSHNNKTRYYLQGTVKNGDEEIITIN